MDDEKNPDEGVNDPSSDALPSDKTPDEGSQNDSNSSAPNKDKLRVKTKDEMLQELYIVFPGTLKEYLASENERINGNLTLYSEFVEDLSLREGRVPDEWKTSSRRKTYQGPPPDVASVLAQYEVPPEDFYHTQKSKEAKLYYENAYNELRNEFRYISVKTIKRVFSENNRRYLPSRRALQALEGNPERKSARPLNECQVSTDFDPQFIKEHAYRKVEDEVREHEHEEKKARQARVEAARAEGKLETCGICQENEIPPEDMVGCPDGHRFCLDCVRGAALASMSDGLVTLDCLDKDVCKMELSLETMKKVLNPKQFERWEKNLRDSVLDLAEIEGLEKCPKCPYAVVMEDPPEKNLLLICLNPKCGARTCRLCHTDEHLPVKCKDVERDDAVKKRKFLEEAMTNELIRRCNKCRTPILRSDGCNHMVCSKCKTHMCYNCKKTISGYDHFGSTTCPSYTRNEDLHVKAVQRAAKAAKIQADDEMPEITLKYDPTVPFEKHPGKS